jgi:hypothetical protein
MNLSKARDFYSAYYEETLDEGLRQAFERAMAQDAQVSAEYRQFVRIMGELKALDNPVGVPADLHLKIRERVDANINALEAKSKTPSWFFGWKPIAYGAVATVAIIGAVASLSNLTTSSQFGTAGMTSVADSAPRLTVDDGVLTLRFASSKPNGVTVTDLGTGRQVTSRTLVDQKLESPIRNSGTEATSVVVQFLQDYDPIMVAVPGTQINGQKSGSGTLFEMARALADRYAAPVVVQAKDSQAKFDWQFDGTDAMNAAVDELKTLGLKAEVREGGLVWISSN